jgi:hypothetical protein
MLIYKFSIHSDKYGIVTFQSNLYQGLFLWESRQHVTVTVHQYLVRMFVMSHVHLHTSYIRSRRNALAHKNFN